MLRIALIALGLTAAAYAVEAQVVITPAAISVPIGGAQTFTATVANGGSVTWSVLEGDSAGKITSAGIYIPPNVAGNFHVVATSTTDPSQSATAFVQVVPPLTYTPLHSFPANSNNADGLFPSGPLIQVEDGTFYGTTGQGGNCSFNDTGCGVVFKVDNDGNYSVVYAFNEVYRWPCGTGDGAEPSGGLIRLGSSFYGTTRAGGNMFCYPWQGGTLFKIDDTGSETLLHSFSAAEGYTPASALTPGSDGYLYGITAGGGSSAYFSGYGGIFKSDLLGNVTFLHYFNGTDGQWPETALMLGTDGYLYGVTPRGGAAGFEGGGTIFKIDSAGAFTLLHSFMGPDGNRPVGLIQGDDGFYYGATYSGGTSADCLPNGCGTIFRIDSKGTFAVLRQLSGADTEAPINLVKGNDGYIYGTTYVYGASNVVFRFDTAGNVTNLHSTGGDDGYYSSAGVIRSRDGNLYGTQSRGGPSYGGVMFKLALPPTPQSELGAISVTTNLAAASYRITGPATFSGNGPTATFDNAPAGTYTITFNAVADYITPGQQTQTLSPGGKLTFSGTYTPVVLTLSPATLLFSYKGANGQAAPQQITVSANAPSINFSAAALTGLSRPWLSITPTSGVTPATLTISVVGLQPPLPPSSYVGQITVTSAGALNSPQVIPVGLEVTDGPPLPSVVPGLTFPIKYDDIQCGGSCTPTSAKFVAIFDHEMDLPYECSGPRFGKIMDFAGEEASDLRSPDHYGDCGQLFGYRNSDDAMFLQGFNYDGSAPARAGVNGSFLYYDSHPGYDYPFAFGKAVFPATSGCVTYKLSAAGKGVDQRTFHVMTVIPKTTKPVSCQTLKPSESDTGYTIAYLHLSSFVGSDGAIERCNFDGTACSDCPECAKEGEWVDSNRALPIAYVGNFAVTTKHATGWQGVGNHLHFEADQWKGGKPIPIDPYGWEPATPKLDPYSQAHPGVVNTKLWSQ